MPESFKVSRNISGFKIKFPAKHHLGLLFFQSYEEEIWYEISRKVKIPSIGGILDIGANIGQSTLIMASIFKNKIISFEPDPEIFKILKENIDRNRLQDRVEAHKKAVYYSKGISVLHKDIRTGGRSSSLIDVISNIHITIETIDFGSLIEKYNPLFIKIDAENAEWKMLEECDSESIKSRYFYIEISDVNLERIINLFSQTHQSEEIRTSGFKKTGNCFKYHYLFIPKLI